jgi:hypothetical protein
MTNAYLMVCLGRRIKTIITITAKPPQANHGFAVGIAARPFQQACRSAVSAGQS